MSKIAKAVRIRKQTIRVNLYFLEALSCKEFGKPYCEATKETNKYLEKITEGYEKLTTGQVERIIFEQFLPEKVKDCLNKFHVRNY